MKQFLKKFLSTGLLGFVCLWGLGAPEAGATRVDWQKSTSNPVYVHEDNAASDPSVIKDGNVYRMIVSGNGGNNPDGNSLIMALSADGKKWNTLQNGKKGVVLASEKQTWDKSLEMPTLLKSGDTYLVFYLGYDPEIAEASGGTIWGDLGRAVSKDGVNFYRSSDKPVMARTPNWYDKDGITDPTIIEENGVLYMIYVGWCITSCAQNGGNPAFYALKATSKDKGVTWTKDGLLDPQSAHGGVPEYTMIGLQHPALVKEGSGAFAIYYGVDHACSNKRTGMYRATGTSPFGPFTVENEPIFCMGTQKFETDGQDGGFPSVLVDQAGIKLYYTGVNVPTYTYQIGLVEKSNAEQQGSVNPVPVPTTPTPATTTPQHPSPTPSTPSTPTTSPTAPRPLPQQPSTPVPVMPQFLENSINTINSTSAHIAARTSVGTQAFLAYGSAYGFNVLSSNAGLSETHSFALTNLISGTKYFYILFAKDKNGFPAYSRIQSFSTKK